MEDQEPDFSGWATKNDLVCSDGRTIKSGAFKHMDKMRVPLVWNHQHKDAENVLGHAILEDRAFGVYTYGFFNQTPRGLHMKEAVKHGDVTAMSIYANNLSERGSGNSRHVLHGDIKEVSLVLAGANPGALIENVNIIHGNVFETLDEEAIIYTGLELEHSAMPEKENDMASDAIKDAAKEILSHAAAATAEKPEVKDAETENKNLEKIFDQFDEEEKEVVYYLLEQALLDGDDEDEKKSDDDPSDEAKHSDVSSEEDDTITHKLDEVSKDEILAHFDQTVNTIKEGLDNHMANIFDQSESNTAAKRKTLSHGLLENIMTDAQRNGSLKEAFLAHAGAEYGIEDIDILFPDAKTLSNTPELISRRTEWVAKVLGETKHSPISRIKSVVADLTADEARAKGYVKGNLKKDEIIKLLKRVTTPTTIYKKQKLDRDDIVDIVDLDVVAWLKAEMRLMLDEEVARAILVGDGREPDDEDKINEDHIRPIAFDVDMYAEKVNLAAGTTPAQFEDAILRARSKYKGTGTPSLFTTDEQLTDLMLQRDGDGRRMYKSVDEVAAAVRVKEIVVVEVMEDVPDVLAIVVNLTDYTVGADRGGQIAMFDDFDIDYNQFKYLIETRISGALTKPKSALVIRRSAGNVVTPQQPAYNPTTRVITIPAQAGVIYSIDGVDKTAGDLPAITETTDVEARPAVGYSFPHNTDADWVFQY